MVGKDKVKTRLSPDPSSTVSSVSFSNEVRYVVDHNYYEEDEHEDADEESYGPKVSFRRQDRGQEKRRPSKGAADRPLSSVSSAFEQKRPAFGLITFFILKILFVDIFIALGDVVSDFGQGFALLLSTTKSSYTGDTWIYGLVTLSINWLPGLVAAIHVFSMYRDVMPAKKTITYAALLLVFYPIVPVAAYLFLLWRSPKNPAKESSRLKRQMSLMRWLSKGKSKSGGRTKVEAELAAIKAREENFRQAEYFSMMAHSIAGGIESPVQFVLQVWLILNGKVPVPWQEFDRITLVDWHGNKISLPTTAAISLTFSMLSMIKSMISINIIRVHIQEITSSSLMWDFLVLLFDHLPFLAATAFFRISATAVLLTYLNSYAFVPLALFWMCNLVIGYRRFQLEHIPLWLISFIALFFPVCFTTREVTDRNRKYLIKLQYGTFWRQCACSTAIFVPALIATAVIINFMPEWRYDSNVLLSNSEFNVAISVVVAMGIVSLILSFHPTWPQLLKSLSKVVSDLEIPNPLTPDVDEVDGPVAPRDRVRFSVSRPGPEQAPAGSKPSIKSQISRLTFKLRGRSKSGGSISGDPAQSPEAIETLDVCKLMAVNPIETNQSPADPDDGETNPLEVTLGEEPPSPQVEEAPIKVRRVMLRSVSAEADHFEKAPDKLAQIKLKRILLGLIWLILIFTPAIIPNVILHCVQPPPSFVYFKPNPMEGNETKIMQGIALNEAGVSAVEGCIRFYLGHKFTMEAKGESKASKGMEGGQLKGLACKKSILVMNRRDWETCQKPQGPEGRPCYHSVDGIVVVDNNWACETYKTTLGTTDDENCFRPSYPLSDLRSSRYIPIPMVLVQRVDAQHTLPKDCDSKPCWVGVTRSNSSIPDTLYSCDANDTNCLPRSGGRLIDLSGRIIGQQYRTVTCQWGGRRCFGYLNTHEVQDYCDEPDIRHKFCRSNGLYFLDKILEVTTVSRPSTDGSAASGIHRRFKMKGYSHELMTCLTEDNVKACDSDQTGMHSWSRCTRPDMDGIKRRYCEISPTCLLEELDIMSSDQDSC